MPHYVKKKTMKRKNKKTKKTRSKRRGKSLRLKQRGGGGDELMDALGGLAAVIAGFITIYSAIMSMSPDQHGFAVRPPPPEVQREILRDELDEQRLLPWELPGQGA